MDTELIDLLNEYYANRQAIETIADPDADLYEILTKPTIEKLKNITGVQP